MIGDNADAKDISFDDSKWRVLNLPHDWNVEGHVNPPPTGDRNTGYFIHGISWYRKVGLTVVDAKMPITVKAEGAKIIGVDNGELNYDGFYKTNTRNVITGEFLLQYKRQHPEKK